MLEKNQGVFSLYLIDENDNERFVLSTENMVVDNGLDMICSRNGEDLLRKCVVSSDNTEVQPKTNSIPMQVATSGNIVSTSARWRRQSRLPRRSLRSSVRRAGRRCGRPAGRRRCRSRCR